MTVRVMVGDCREVLRSLEAESVHCVVTSPPYYGLRAYRIPATTWGGDDACEHEWGDEVGSSGRRNDNGGLAFTGTGAPGTRMPGLAAMAPGGASEGCFCSRCGAWRGELGLEPDWRMWLVHMVEVFREVRRVLRRDGTLWLNVGDTYASGAGADGAHPGGGAQGARWKGEAGPDFGSAARKWADRPALGETSQKRRRRADRDPEHAGKHEAMGPMTQPNRMPQPRMKPKDRMMLPARLAIALCDDGWWLRDEVVWCKPNPMPSSVEDRTTPAHEMVYLLSKFRRYFHDGHAIKEPFAESSIKRMMQDGVPLERGGERQDQYDAFGVNEMNGSRRPVEVLQGLAQRIVRKPQGWDSRDGAHATIDYAAARGGEAKFGDGHGNGESSWEGGRRNKRSVWTIATEPFPDAHFAVFPTALVEPMILAGTSERGCCRECGAPWRRVVAKLFRPQGDISAAKAQRARAGQKPLDASSNWQGTTRGAVDAWTLGFWPSCGCDGLGDLPRYPPRPREKSALQAWERSVAAIDRARAAACEAAARIRTTPCVVLDPFGGSGTVGAVADALRRDAVLVEIGEQYAAMARRRIHGPLFAELGRAAE